LNAESRLHITNRESQVVRLAGRGYSDNRIASILRVAPSTIRNHMSAVCHKVGALNRFTCGILAERTRLLRRLRTL
jgi:DNA-binding NarL/FixJ family response regulator